MQFSVLFVFSSLNCKKNFKNYYCKMSSNRQLGPLHMIWFIAIDGAFSVIAGENIQAEQ